MQLISYYSVILFHVARCNIVYRLQCSVLFIILCQVDVPFILELLHYFVLIGL